MVAITVILAAVIGAFVVDLGNSVNEQASAGVTLADSANSSAYENVTVTSLGDSTTGIKCVSDGDKDGVTATRVGATIECDDGGSIVAYSDDGDIEDKTIRTNIGD